MGLALQLLSVSMSLIAAWLWARAHAPSPSCSPAPVILKPFETNLRPVYGPESRPDFLHEHECSWHVSPGGIPPFGGSHLLRLGVGDKPEIAQEVPPRDTPHFL